VEGTDEELEDGFSGFVSVFVEMIPGVLEPNGFDIF